MYTNILLPTDGSSACRAAAEAGVALAAKFGAKVTAFYAAPAPTPLVYRKLMPIGIDTVQHNKQLIQEAAAKYLQTIAKLAKLANVSCDLVSATSDFPADAILAIAKKHKCDLIVLAPHTRKGLAKMLLGSQTNKVLANASIPVLVHR